MKFGDNAGVHTLRSATPMITTKRLRRRFLVGDTTVHALDEVDLEISEGDFVAMMGTSGSGKSTLMNTLGFLDTPDSGCTRPCRLRGSIRCGPASRNSSAN